MKSKLFRSVVLAVLIGALLSTLKWTGVLVQELEFNLLNFYYTSRDADKVNVDSNICFIPLHDDDLEQSRWPWSWDKFAYISNTLKRYNVEVGMVMDDAFSELGSTTVDKDTAEAFKATIRSALAGEEGTDLDETLSSIATDSNGKFIEAIKENSDMLLSQKFIITDDQSDKEAMLARSKAKMSRFSKKKLEAIKAVEKYSLPWGEDPGDLLQAIDILPLWNQLAEVTHLVGFNRIIPDADGTVRRAPTVVYYDGRVYFSQGIVAAIDYLGCEMKDLELKPGEFLKIKNIDHEGQPNEISIPIDEKGMMYVNWTSKEQEKAFANYPFEMVKGFMANEIAKNLIAEAEFDPDVEVINYLTDLFVQELGSSGFIMKDEVTGALETLLYVWCINAITQGDLTEPEVFGGIVDSFEDAMENVSDRVEQEDVLAIFNSIKLNQFLVSEYEPDALPDFESLVEDSGVNVNWIYLNHLSVYDVPLESIQKLLEIGLMAVAPDSDPENPIIVVNKHDVPDEDYSSMLRMKLELNDEEIEAGNYKTAYDLMQINNNIYQVGYDYTKYFIQSGNIAEVQPLYFYDNKNLKNEFGQDVPISLLNIADKSVFIGLTATGLSAQNPTPYSQRQVMAALTPTVLNMIISNSFIEDLQWTTYILVFVFSFIILLVTFKARFIVSFPTIVVICLAYGWLCFNLFAEQGIIFSLVTPMGSLILSYVVANLYMYWEEQQEKKKIRGMFAAMVSPEVLKIMEEEPDKFNLQGEKIEASMFSSDVSGFTSISEGVTASELAQILNLYLTPMSDLVMIYGGYVEKYEGDAIKADFGMPLPDNNHAWKACFSALLQQEELTVVQRMLQLKYGVMITARMGVNTGVVNAGNMGSENKMQYCAIGEEVAMAEELEPSNKMWETWIAISPETLRLSGERVEIRLLDNVIYEHTTIPVYELLGWNENDFLSYWEGKAIPELVVEGWQKIIPEKILAYLDYYREREDRLGSFEFCQLLLDSLGDLQDESIEYVKLSDKLGVYDVEKRYKQL
ncbi:MAG: CHASE2 domain-containing protein, partial [Planctomycetes bacterium]|nr:CHASE2 domain-containing protein [Planctomycetota bacterium]